MFGFSKKSSKDSQNFSFLGTDIHSHLIYGIDDGARSAEESIELLVNLKRLGFEKFITTPHIFKDYYPNTPETINEGFKKVNLALEEANQEFDIHPAAEYYGDEHLLNLIDQDEKLMTFGVNYVLVETSMLAEIPLLPQIIFKLKTQNYKPILAHPERYLYNRKTPEFYKALDCSLQVNLLSLAGYYGSEQKKFGLELIESGMVDFLGSDIHHANQIPYLDKIAKNNKIMKAIRKHSYKNATL